MAEIEQLFKAAPLKKEQLEGTKKSQPAMALGFIEGKRAQNIVIGLAQFKGLSENNYERLFRSICCLDDVDGFLTADNLENLQPLLPTDSELTAMRNMAVSLTHPAEVFMQGAAKYYPDLRSRLASTLLANSFAVDAEDVLKRSTALIDTCNQILSSDKLARIMQKMLAIGNIMNEGTHRGEASGFTLDSLMKMVNTKGVDKKTTVLDYVVKSTIDRGDSHVLDIADDLEMLSVNCKLSGKDVRAAMDTVTKNFKAMESDIHAIKSQTDFGCKEREQLAVGFSGALEEKMTGWMELYTSLNKSQKLRTRKTKELVEYFGEDPTKTDTVDIFSVLQKFLRSVLLSKEACLRTRKK
jgi:hypothetical protein